MMWQYHNPVKIVFSDNLQQSIKLITKQSGKILIVCSDRFKKTEHFRQLTCKQNNFYTFSDIEQNPSLESCGRAIEFVEIYQPRVIIAIGGGSVIDTAKVMRMAIHNNCYGIEKLIEGACNQVDKPLFVGVPTTHGSGSELTMWATIWDKVSKKKYSISEYDNYPDYAIYDVRLFDSLPESVSISSTLDALSHAFESLWNKNANPISDHFSTESIKLIITNLDKLRSPVPTMARSNLLMASIYAGLAFSNTMTAAAHSISYPLTSYFNISHGIACSMPLYSLLKINEKAIHDKIARLLHVLQSTNIDELWTKVLNILKNRIPFTLREYGIKRKDLNWLSELAFTKDRIDNNIVDLDTGDVLRILEEIY